MKKLSTLSVIAMIGMAAISFINLFGIRAAGISVCAGVVFFFINKAIEKQPFEGSGLDIKSVGTGLKQKYVWIWMLLPILMDFVSITLSKLFLPEYIPHVLARAGNFVSFDKAALLVFQMMVLALGEEIAWRAFFQKQLLKVMPLTPILIISAILFGIGHFEAGNPVVVAYDVFFVAVNGALYGILFHKTNNAWVSGISHFAANLFSVIVLIPYLH